MSRWLALAETAKENTDTLPDNPTIPDKTPRKQPQVAFCRVMSGCRVEVKEKVGDTEFSLRNENPDTAADNEFSRRREKPDTDAFEERAAIAEYDGGLTRADAEQVAAQGQGFSNVIEFKAAQQRRASDE
jgi:hypothetical protein